MRATDLLREMHRGLEGLVERALSARGPERIRVLGELSEELLLHSAVEEEHLYPLLQGSGGEAAARSLDEDRKIRVLVGEILELKRHDPRLDEKLAELARTARDHLAAEERTVLPLIESSASPDQLEALGREMGRMAERLRGAELLKSDDELAPARA